MDEPVTEAELHAWMDGELPATRVAAVEAHFTAHPEDRARFASYQAQAALIRRAFAPLAEAAGPPPGSPPGPSALVAPPPARRARWLALAAALALFVAGTGSGWLLRDLSVPGLASGGVAVARPVTDALVAHRVFVADQRHPVEVGADQEAHLVAWLSRRLGVPLAAPRLAGAGFELIGGRLLPAQDGPAAQFMYQDAAGRRVTLYVTARPEADDTAFRFAEEGPLGAFFWKDRGLAWTLAGTLDRATLRDLAIRVYAELQI